MEPRHGRNRRLPAHRVCLRALVYCKPKDLLRGPEALLLHVCSCNRLAQLQHCCRYASHAQQITHVKTDELRTTSA